MAEILDLKINEAAKLEELKPGNFFVVKPDCIACDACANEFADLFFMMDWQGERKAEAHLNKERQAAQMDLWKVIKICPTGAIKFDGELPKEPEETVSFEIVPGWEEKWLARQKDRKNALHTGNRDSRDSNSERNRRYGLVREILDFEDRTVVRIHMPTVTPEIDLKYKYGIPDEMPDYSYEVKLLNPNLLEVKASVTDPKVKALCYKANAFPAQFVATLSLPNAVVKTKERYSEYILQIVCFKENKAYEQHVWNSHYITTDCTGCMICLSKCPTSAITGDRDRRHFINEDLCINCRTCGVYCPFNAIDDEKGLRVPYVKPKEVPKAKVIDELCTGCSFCVDVCPTDCIELQPEENGIPGSPVHIVARVDERKCISCKICEHVCIKDAIIIDREVPFVPDIGFSFQYNPTEEGRVMGPFSDQIMADAPLMLSNVITARKQTPSSEE